MQLRNHAMFRRTGLVFGLILASFFALTVPAAQAQGRMNDHDMEALMRNLRDDAKSFRPRFEKAVDKSTIRKTSQARDTKELAATFERQTDGLLNRFKKDRNGQEEFSSVLATAQQLDQAVQTLALGPEVTEQWNRIRTEVHQIAVAYGVRDSFLPPDTQADLTGPSSERSCLQTAGAAKANRLVNQCLEVSPATHPPCHVENSCALIISEIRRSCALIGTSAPAFCTEYH